MKKSGEYHYLGHHMPNGRDGVEIRIHEDEWGYYASTIFNPQGPCPADLGPFDTSFKAMAACCARHGVEFVGNDNLGEYRRRRVQDERTSAMAW